MDYREFSMYYKAIDVIEAQETLVQMKISDFPTMKEDARAELFQSLNKKAYPKERKVYTTRELARKLGMI